ncbi:MAG: ferredoxin [Planctomycetes bacterium]|jgi:hypothetical protein|nr:ferredoxin [Planctomycetota bacterium]
MSDQPASPRVIISPLELKVWRVLQGLVFLVGLVILVALFVAPKLGLHLLWNVLIPVAPALLVIAPGIWRNVCPMATTSLMPRHLGLSRRKHLSAAAQGWMAVGALVLLLVIVPLRHVILDSSGLAIGLALVIVAALTVALGMVFEWKSAWCSGLCPVYPVELLYGEEPLLSVKNAHCKSCENCVLPCKDGTPDLHPANASQGKPALISGLILTGGFPGFIWGWYQVPTYEGWQGFMNLHIAYGFPFAAMAASLLMFLGLRALLQPSLQRTLTRVFAAAAVIVYYWFKAPVMLGFGADPASAIIDLHQVLPTSTPEILRAICILAFSYLLVLKRHAGRVWAAKPLDVQRGTQP